MAFPPESAGDRVRFGNDGFLGVHVRVLIDTMLKGIIAATFSEASSKLKVLSLPGSEGWFAYLGWSSTLAEARERLTVNLFGIKPRRIILHDDLDSGSDDEDGDDVD